MNLIGMKKEIERLDSLMNSGVSEFLALYGRRRIGKTFLIREYFKSHIVLDFSGAFEVEYDLQLDNFFSEYTRHTKNRREQELPKNWRIAFNYIADYLRKDHPAYGYSRIDIQSAFHFIHTLFLDSRKEDIKCRSKPCMAGR